MDVPLAQLLRRGLRLALLYSAAALIFIGALGGAITLALGGANGAKPAPLAPEKPVDVKPTTTSNTPSGAPIARPSTGKTEI